MLIKFVLYCILIFASAIVVNVARYLVEPMQMYHARRHIIDSAGGVRTLIALHHGRKTKSESFASCRDRVNIFGGSEIALLNEECNGDSVSVAVHSKVKKCLRNKATSIIPLWQICCYEATEEIQNESKLQPCSRIYSFGNSYTQIRRLCEWYQIRELFNGESTLDMQTHYKETATFWYTDYFSCHRL